MGVPSNGNYHNGESDTLDICIGIQKLLSQKEYDLYQKLLSQILIDCLRDAVNGKPEAKQKALGWIFDDPPVGYKYPVPFVEFCSYLGFNSDIFTLGFDLNLKKLEKSKKLRIKKRSYAF